MTNEVSLNENTKKSYREIKKEEAKRGFFIPFSSVYSC